jgi:hypothetical protein
VFSERPLILWRGRLDGVNCIEQANWMQKVDLKVELTKRRAFGE